MHGYMHCTGYCKSNRNCQSYGGRHDSFICGKNSTKSTALAVTEKNAVYSNVLVQVNKTNRRVLLDAGAGSSCASAI